MFDAPLSSSPLLVLYEVIAKQYVTPAVRTPDSFHVSVVELSESCANFHVVLEKAGHAVCVEESAIS
jgi:hypothetical protein